MTQDESSKVRSSRLGRVAMLGGMAARLAGDAASAAGRLASSASSDAAAKTLHKGVSKTLVRHLGEMKGLPMKLGQMLSYIDDWVPAEHRETYRETLQELQVRSRPMLWESIETMMREDLGASPDELFASFDRTPIAAASIGQVYRAALHDGRQVAVKVQYPGIADAVASDLKNIDSIIRALSVALPKVDVEQSLRDVSSRLLEECDYAAELAHQQAFVAAWAHDDDMIVPDVVPELCGARVLTTEFIEGRRWDDMLTDSSPAERSQYGLAIFRFVFHSMYVHGRFNGDPHPGNYLFLPDGKVAFLDFGCVQAYDRDSLERFAHVRNLAQRSVRGSDFRAAAISAYGLPAEADDEMWDAFEDYLYLSFEPLLAAQPYFYDRDYTMRLAKRTAEMKLLVAKKLFKTGIFDTKRPGAVFLHRINFGLNSILAQLGAEADWPAEVDAIYRAGGFEESNTRTASVDV
ncbi:MAG: AarF/ABC1/UbiB kinase family protein [Myxococcales bacterium]|nr:AarF/ABC1/UbiB kinase family protein [Myxococcales bacterium]